MKVRCVGCDRFDLRKAGERLSRQGFGCCAMRPSWETKAARFERECGFFRPVTAETEARRVQFINNNTATRRT